MLDGRFIADVGFDGKSADAVRNFTSCVSIDVGHQNTAGTLSRESCGECRSDPVSSPGHHDRLTRDFHTSSSMLRAVIVNVH